MTQVEICAQCEANARCNEAGGYHELAEQCREYCRRGHKAETEIEIVKAQLRDLFPDGPDFDAWFSKMRNQPNAIIRVRGAHFFGDNFDECMVQVRQWKELLSAHVASR